MTKPTGKPRGRPKGSKNIEKSLSLYDLWDSLSAKEKKATFQRATPNEKLRLIGALERKAKEGENVTIKFNLYGVRRSVCPNCGHVLAEEDTRKSAPRPDRPEPVKPNPGDSRAPRPFPGKSSPDIVAIREDAEEPPEEREETPEEEFFREVQEQFEKDQEDEWFRDQQKGVEDA